MQVILVGKNFMNKLILPKEVNGNYWLNDEESKKVINIQAINGKWEISSTNLAKIRFKSDISTINNEITYVSRTGNDNCIESITLEENDVQYFTIGDSKNIYLLYCLPVYADELYELKIKNVKELTIGKNEKSSIIYKNPLINTTHVRMILYNGAWRIENLDLKIGTFVGIIIDELEINGINEIKDKQKENEEDICEYGKVHFTNFERLINTIENNRSHYLILNKMTIIFNNKEYQKFMRILGEPFFKNNKNNIKIIVNDLELSELKPVIYTGFKREIIIILLEINTITDFSFMFYQCSSLVALPDISNWNMTNVENMSYMFAGCTELNFFPNILNWNTSNVTEIKGIFFGCSSLKFLPDISK